MKQSPQPEIPKKKQSITSRIKTAIVVLPILFSMFYFSFLYLILMFIVIYVSHKEYYVIESNIMKNLFTDQFSDSTSSTLISSPLQTYIILLLPCLIYIFPNSESCSCTLILSLLIIYRLTSFISIYMLNNIKDFEMDKQLLESTSGANVPKMKNPMPKGDNSESSLSRQKSNGGNIREQSKTFTPTNQPTQHNSTLTSLKNSFNKQYITNKMLSSCLIVIALDFIFIFTYALPLCYGISLHHLNVGFTYVSFVVVIAYSCDIGALFTGISIGKTQFGAPITPSKTWEGVYGGILTAFLCGTVYRLVVVHMTNVKCFNNKTLVLFILLETISAILGDYFESFLKRCGEIKDSGTLFPGHGGLLDRIDSITLGLPICYYFVKLIP